MAAGFSASQLLASAFSSSLKCKVITQEQYERQQNKSDGHFTAVNIDQLFGISQVTGAVGDVRLPSPSTADDFSSAFHVNVKTPTGRTFDLKVTPHFLVKDLMKAITGVEGIPWDQQRVRPCKKNYLFIIRKKIFKGEGGHFLFLFFIFKKSWFF